MISKAKLSYLRISPRKVRLVADIVRGETVEKAQVILNFTQKKAATPILKLLKQAIANAKNTLQVEEKNLYISKIIVDEGIKLKRYLPRARGRADVIHKKTSHITIVLDEIAGEAKVKAIKAVAKKKKKTKVRIKKKGLAKGIEKSEVEKSKEEIDAKSKKTRQRQEIKKLKTRRQKGLKRFFRRKAI